MSPRTVTVTRGALLARRDAILAELGDPAW